MVALLITIHIILCILLVISVLLQSGKGSDIGSMLGGGMVGDALDSHSAMQTLAKFTTIVAILFFFSSIVLALVGLRQQKSGVLDQLDNVSKKQKTEQVAPTGTPAVTPGAVKEEGKVEEGAAKKVEPVKEEVKKEEAKPAEAVREKPKAEGGVPELSKPQEPVPIQETPKESPAKAVTPEKK